MLYKIVVPALLSFVIATTCGAQEKKPDVEVTIDGLTKLPDKYAPFDQEFILNLPVDSSFKESEVRESVMIYKLEKGKRKNDFNEMLAGFPAKKLEFVKTKGKHNQVKLMVPPLKPNSNYGFQLQFDPDATVKALREFNYMIDDSNVSEENRRKYFDKINKSMSDFNGDAVNIFRDGLENETLTIDSEGVKREQYEKFYADSISTVMKLLKDAFLDTDNVESDITRLQKDFKTCGLCALLSKCNCEGEFIVQEVKVSMPSLLLNTCDSAQVLAYGVKAIALSNTSIDSLTNRTASTGKFYRSPKMLFANIAANIAYFKSVRKVLAESTMTSVMPDSCRLSLIQSIDTIVGKLEKRRKAATAQYDIIEKKIKAVFTRGLFTAPDQPATSFFTYIQLSAISVSTATIKSQAGNYFIPEIGLVNMWSSRTVNAPTYFLRPYLGMNISFRPINKDIRLRDIPKPQIWHRLSASVGVTRHSIATNHPEISDLMKDFCLMTGLNVRLTRAFRIGAGAAWYRADNTNPLLSDQVTAMPYVSLALDVDVVDWAKTITDFFIK